MVETLVYTNFITEGSFALALLCLVIWLVCKRKTKALSTQYKLSIALLFAMYTIFIFTDIYRVVNGFLEGNLDCSKWYFFFDISVACLLFEIFHWQFTSHYLKVACIFKLTFSDRS